MNAKELQIENERLKELLSKAEREREEHVASLLQRHQDQLAQAHAQQAAVAEQFSQALAEKDQQVASLKHQINLLLQRIKGSRQERINPDQLMLFSLEELQAIADELEQSDDEAHPGDDGSSDSNEDDKKRKRGRSRRKRLPKNIRREILRHELSPQERACPCCGEQRQEMGFVRSEQLEYIPAQWKATEHQRVKYACRTCTENVVIADKPPQPIEKGLPGPGLCAHTVLSKFGDHQPLYRQEDIHSRTGLVIRRSTLCGWLQALALLACPLVMRMKYLQADAYSGYDCIFASKQVHEVACWIHARRYWYEARDNDAARANMALGFIARLSQIESQLAAAYPRKNLQGERDFAAVARGRQQYSLPILHDFKAWMDSELKTGRILPKSEIRKAFTYTLNQWNALCRYTQEGFLSYDNNVAERLVKISAIGRKNYLFVGNEQAGHNAAVLYSLVSSAKANGVEPFAWLRDIFTQLPYHRSGDAFAQSQAGQPVTSSELDHLLPDRWLLANPEHTWTIDAVRRQERKQKRQAPKRRRPNR